MARITRAQNRSLQAFLACLAVTSAMLLLTRVPASAQPEDRENANPRDMGAALADTMRKVKGCLGVDIGQFQSGKLSIIGWYEDRKAVLRWYYHPMHAGLMATAGGADGPPLEHVDEDEGPIMVIATITPTSDPEKALPGVPFQISQISIELFKPLPGGAFINGRFSPEKFEVEHMRSISMDE